MPDASERGGGLASIYRMIKSKADGYTRLDKAKMIEDAKKAAGQKGNGRNAVKAPSLKGGSKKK